jgi:hypothetical protein
MIDLEALYKGNLPNSHEAALKAVYDAGYADGSGELKDEPVAEELPTQEEPPVPEEPPKE